MRRIEVKQLDYDLTPAGGLALVGHCLKALTPPVGQAGWQAASAGQGEQQRRGPELPGDKFFTEALGIGLPPSSPTLRQRLDTQAGAMFEHVPGMIERRLGSQRPPLRPAGMRLAAA